MSSSSGTESETGLNERKRIHSDSDSEDNEAAVAKPVKVAKITKTVQKSISGFFSNGESKVVDLKEGSFFLRALTL